MSIVNPFKGIRPKNQKIASEMISLPYDVMNRSEAKNMAKNKKYSFLKIIRSEINLNKNIDQYSEKVYLKAKEILDNWLKKGILEKDKENYFYIYRQEMNKKIQTGLVGTVSIDDYINNVIKKHELTRKEKEEDRIKHFDICNANTEPVFLTYRKNNNINNIIKKWIEKNKPIYDLITEDNIKHTVWILSDRLLIDNLVKLFCNIDSLYIADGHHRSASSVEAGLKRRKENFNYSGDEEFNRFLAVIFPDEELYIMGYNRVIKDLNNMSSDQFINKIKENFIIEKILNSNFSPKKKGEIGMFLNKEWYKLELKKELLTKNNNPVRNLDASILQNNLLSPILGIKDPRTDKRIDFVGGIRGIDELENRAKTGNKVAFSLYPVNIKDLLAVSDANKIMPPKSTWFEPKLRSGFFIHSLE